MKTIVILCALAALTFSGCTVTTYEAPGGVKFTRTSFGTKQSVSKLSVTTDPKTGVQTLKLDGFSNDQTETAAAVAGAVATALSK